MASPVLIVEKSDSVATLTLNRPEAMNALSSALRLALAGALRELREDSSVRVAILTGAGRAFCAGMDLKELASGAQQGAGEAASGAGFAELPEAIAAFEGPIIAAVNGPAITGGFELALACDLIIASTQATFADTHARVGLLPGWGLSQKLPRMIGVGRAKELSFTGNKITAAQACEWGLVNRVVAPEELLPACKSLAADMASCVPAALEGYKRLIDDGYGMPLAAALRHEVTVSRDFAESVTASVVAARREGVLERGRAQHNPEGKS